jgi:hypothetical protein
MRSILASHRLSALRLLSLIVGPGLFAACTAEPIDIESTESTSSEIKNCPVTDPDYPLCSITTPKVCPDAAGSVSASSTNITYDQSVTISWNATIPAKCTGALTLNGLAVGSSGSKTFTPRSDTTYVLRLGSVNLATVRVGVTLPSTVRIEGSTPEWRALLIQALDTPGKRVVLGPNVDMDLTGYEKIRIRDGVTLTSEAPPPVLQTFAMSQTVAAPHNLATDRTIAMNADVAVRPIHTVHPIGGIFDVMRPPLRDARNLGPRLYTRSRPKPLFTLSCDDPNFTSNNIHIVGFRIQGPDFETMEGDDKLERGVQIDSCLGVEIANMELSGWSGAAIYVADNRGRQLGPDAISIHDNFIHHNQHAGGNGYGVDFSAGAYGLVEHNVFDHNRHAITSSGKAGTGYKANQNLVLAGGGHHDTFFNSYTQLFDVHGDANCPDIWPFQHTWQCGNAGDQYWMTNNAFQFTKDHPIKIRGTPRIQGIFSGNVFPQEDRDDAIATTQGLTNISIGANTYGVNTFGEYGVCDFDGDGKDDLFLATGASWWFMSAGKMHWTYLSPYTERLSQVRLGDFDGDHRCDVLAINHGANQWEIASGGSGTWSALPGSYPGIPIGELATGDFNGDGVTDIFRRAPDGQWWAISPGRYGWTALQSSSTPLDDLKLGDFNGDGVTDVLGRNGGKWAISWSAQSAWQPAGSGLSDDLSHVYVANVDGLPGDDIVRYSTNGLSQGRWQVSSGAQTAWQSFASYSWPSNSSATDPQLRAPAAFARTFLGRFRGTSNADLLVIDATRTGRIATATSSSFAPHGLYSY